MALGSPCSLCTSCFEGISRTQNKNGILWVLLFVSRINLNILYKGPNFYNILKYVGANYIFHYIPQTTYSDYRKVQIVSFIQDTDCIPGTTDSYVMTPHSDLNT